MYPAPPVPSPPRGNRSSFWPAQALVRTARKTARKRRLCGPYPGELSTQSQARPNMAGASRDKHHSVALSWAGKTRLVSWYPSFGTLGSPTTEWSRRTKGRRLSSGSSPICVRSQANGTEKKHGPEGPVQQVHGPSLSLVTVYYTQALYLARF